MIVRLDCEWSLIFLCKVEKPKHASCEAASRESAINEGISPRRKNKSADSFVLPGDSEAVKVT